MSRGIAVLLIQFLFMLLTWLFLDVMSVALGKLGIAPDGDRNLANNCT